MPHKFRWICAAFLLVPQLPAQQAAPEPAPPTEAQQIAQMQTKLNDWAQLNRYREDNASLPPPAPGTQRVVFYGDSITDNWGRYPNTGPFFPGKPYVNRGISGQTTPQMLVRFQQDVVHLHPAAVLILAGTNDIAGNTGPETPEMIEDNFRSMTAIARESGIKLIVASVLPAYSYHWKPGVAPAEQIRSLNQWLKDYCTQEHLTYLDYYSALVDNTPGNAGGMKPGLSFDGVHPTAQGYAIMAPLAEAAIAQTLRK